MASVGDIDINIISDDTFEKLCIMCKRKKQNTEAAKYCIDCQDYYCSKCVNVHEDVPLLNDHEILDKNKFSSGSSSTVTIPKAPTEKCERHKHQHVDMYCEDHDVVGCWTCMAVDHGSCQGLFYISEYSKADVNTSVLEQKLKLIAKSLDENQAYFHNKKQLLLKERRKLLKEIKGLRKEVNEKLDELEKITLHQIQSEFDTLIKQAEKQINIIHTYKKDVKSTLNKFGSSNISGSQTFVNYKKGEKIIDSADGQQENLNQDRQTITVAFNTFKEVRDLLETENGLGKVKQIHLQDSLLHVGGNVKRSVRAKTDRKKCDIVSGCVVGNKAIILADRENRNLKRFEVSVPAIKEHYQLPGQTWQVCAVGQDKVAVCLPDIKAVHFVLIRKRMAKSKKIKTDFDCYGIAYNCGTLYISDFGSSVYVYNISGEKLNTLTNNSSGTRLFKNMHSLAVNRSHIYITDTNNGVITLGKDGEIVNVDESENIDAYGCSLTTRDNLLVYDENQKRVLQYRDNGDFVGTVVKPKVKSSQMVDNLRTIICDKEMTLLIIAGYDNYVLIYKLTEKM